MKFIKENFNHYNFKHKEVYKKFEGDLEYCNTFCVLGNYDPAAVYHSKNPNREKNHKDYMLLFTKYDPSVDKSFVVVSGLNKDEIEEYRYQKGLWCLDCDDVIYSVYRHDCRECKCGSIFIDGGKDYSRVGCSEKSRYHAVRIDLLTDKIVTYQYIEADKKVDLNNLEDFPTGDHGSFGTNSL